MGGTFVVAWEFQQLTSIRRGGPDDEVPMRGSTSPQQGSMLRVAATSWCGAAGTARWGGSGTEVLLTSAMYCDGGPR
jgi:hypothetical protein